MKRETRRQLKRLAEDIEFFMREPENYSKKLDEALQDALDYIRDEIGQNGR